MARSVYLLLLGAFASICWSETPNFEFLDKSIVKVRTHRDHPTGKEDEDETGTGFVVTAAGGVIRMITAGHVVTNATKVDVTFNSDKVTSVPVHVLPQASDVLDLAVLELRVTPAMHLDTRFPILNWVPRDGMHASDHVWTIDGDWDPAPNTIIRLDHTANPSFFEYTPVSVGQGYSGAPVFNDRGLLLGIHVRQANRADYKLSVAIKIDAALETLNALGYTSSTFNGLAQARPATPGAPGVPIPANPLVAAPSGNASPAPKEAPAKPVLWRDLNNNQLYQIRVDANHMYISQTNGAVVADLGYGKNKKGLTGFFGNSSLSTCPGPGYMEILNVSETRMEGRVEQKPAAANVNCGGVFGMLRNLVPIAFVKEAAR